MENKKRGFEYYKMKLLDDKVESGLMYYPEVMKGTWITGNTLNEENVENTTNPLENATIEMIGEEFAIRGNIDFFKEVGVLKSRILERSYTIRIIEDNGTAHYLKDAFHATNENLTKIFWDKYMR